MRSASGQRGKYSEYLLFRTPSLLSATAPEEEEEDNEEDELYSDESADGEDSVEGGCKAARS